MVNNKLLPRKLLLRATLKIFTTIALLWLGYIFTAGFFGNTGTSKPAQYEFNLSSLADNSANYFKLDQRELLVIKINDKYSIFWSHDPVYGCRLEFFNSVIKPVCIDIEYDLDGFSIDRRQQLLKPEYKITLQSELIVY